MDVNIFAARQRSWGQVMFSVMSVRHSVHRGSHVIITHDTLDLTVHPFLGHGTSLVLTSDGY